MIGYFSRYKARQHPNPTVSNIYGMESLHMLEQKYLHYCRNVFYVGSIIPNLIIYGKMGGTIDMAIDVKNG